MTDETQVEQQVQEPVEQPIAAEAESTPAEVEAVAETVDQEVPAEPAQPEWFQKRINEITAEKYREKQEKEALERQLQELRSQVQPVEAPKKMPQLADFDYDEDAFAAALVQHQEQIARKTVQSEYQRLQEQQRKQAEIEAFNQVAVSFQQKGEALKARNPDFDQTINQIPELPVDTRLALMQSDKGAEIAYYLGKHLDQADRIASLPPIQAAMEIARLEYKFSAQPKTGSRTPAPPPSVGGGSGSAPFDPADTSVPLDQWMAQMEARDKAKLGL